MQRYCTTSSLPAPAGSEAPTCADATHCVADMGLLEASVFYWGGEKFTFALDIFQDRTKTSIQQEDITNVYI